MATDILEEIKVGHKRNFTQAMQVQHFRDYAFSQIKGGAKGEKADYALVEAAPGELRYLPITSKFKLNKKRKANAGFSMKREDEYDMDNFAPQMQQGKG